MMSRVFTSPQRKGVCSTGCKCVIPLDREIGLRLLLLIVSFGPYNIYKAILKTGTDTVSSELKIFSKK